MRRPPGDDWVAQRASPSGPIRRISDCPSVPEADTVRSVISDWPPPANTWTLDDDAIHVWVAALDLPPETQTVFERVLSMEELERARRFHFERDRRRYVATHGLLRCLLSRYLSLAPNAVRLAADRHGKPHIVPEMNAAGLQFNLSHSAELALFGFTRHRRIGVDLEKVRPDFAIDDVAANHFSHHELAQLRSLPAAQQADAFFTCWTRKEALLKACGCGLAVGLQAIEVSFLPNEPAQILQAPGITPEQRWSVTHLVPAPGFVGAVVAEGQVSRVGTWRCDFQNVAGLPVLLGSEFAGPGGHVQRRE